MKLEKHLAKAKRLEDTQSKLDPDEDWETIIEDVYGAALHYIACKCQTHFGIHLDTHVGLPKYLDDHGLPGLAQLFRDLDHKRLAMWYGGHGNGDAIRSAREMLEKIKKLCGVDG